MPEGFFTRSSRRVLEPIDRVSEVLFGLIMVLTFTGSLSVAEAGRENIRTMLIGALGCNLAWGIIDGVLLYDGLSGGQGAGTAHVSRRAQSHRSKKSAAPHRGRSTAGDCVHLGTGRTRNDAPTFAATTRATRESTAG